MPRDDRFKGAFYQGRKKPSLLRKIGVGLMGFGEGYAGRGQQYVAGLREQAEKEQNDLMRASISDAKQVLRHLGNIPPVDAVDPMQEVAYGNVERMTGLDPYSAPTGLNPLVATNQAYNQAGIQESVDILNDRVGLLRERGQDDSETMWLRDKLLSGDIESAKSEIAGFLAQAKDEGFATDTQDYVTGLTETADGRLARFVENPDGTYTPEYFGEKTPRAPVPAGSEIGKINQDYLSGRFGVVGSPAATAMRDKAIEDATYRAPQFTEDRWGVTRVYNPSTGQFDSIPAASSATQAVPPVVPPVGPQVDPQADSQVWPGVPFRREVTQNNLEVEPRPIDPAEYVTYDQAIGPMPARYPDEPDHVYDARAREDLQARNAYKRAESARVRAAQAELSVENRAFAKTKNLASTIVRLRNNQSGLTAIVGEYGRVGRAFTGVGDFIAGLAQFDQQKDRASALADIEALKGMLLVEELDLMTGPLTDKDLEVLLDSATSLGNTKQTHEAFNRELDRVLNTIRDGIRESARQGRITAAQASEMLQVFSLLGQEPTQDQRSMSTTWGRDAFDPDNPDQAKPPGY